MKLSIAKFYPADLSNYTKGRVRPIDQITIHHTAGQEATLRYLWQNPARNASSHFFVHPTKIEQYVDTSDIAWTNSNFDSNSRSITIEVQGDWRNGYYNQAALNKLYELLIQLRRQWPHAKLTYHMDEAAKVGRSTLCPADLKHKGYAKKQWDKAADALQPADPPQSSISYRPIEPRRVKLIRAANLWDFDFSKWSDTKAVGDVYPKGHIVDVIAIATNKLGGEYYMTAYSLGTSKPEVIARAGFEPRFKRGFNVADTQVVTVPEKPPEDDKELPQPPIDTNPDEPGDSEYEQRLSALEKAVQAILDWIASIGASITNLIKGK